MRTSKFISTISYNSEVFLQNVLNNLISDKKIVFWAYIMHFPELGERKKHIHLILQPNGIINTDILSDLFVEPVADSEIPLNVMPWRSSNFLDFILYGIHDSNYLAKKLLKKKFHYSIADFQTSDFAYLNEMFYSSDMSKYSRLDFLKTALEHGLTFPQCVACGFIPLAQAKQYQFVYQCLLSNRINENANSDFVRVNHLKPVNLTFDDII